MIFTCEAAWQGFKAIKRSATTYISEAASGWLGDYLKPVGDRS